MDIAGGIVGLILTGIAYIFVAPAIKKESPGPVFFKQNRVTKNGKIFNVLKFRSMVVDADKDGAKKAENNDDRITPVGKIIRPVRVDELPQFWNVLKGEMSLVGPRPAIPREVEQYTPYQKQRLFVKPGLTCIWQVSGRNNIEFDQWVELDIEYIKTRSLWLDIKLILLTIPALLGDENAS